MLDRVNILALEFDTLKEIRAINPRVKTVVLMSEEYFRSRAIATLPPSLTT